MTGFRRARVRAPLLAIALVALLALTGPAGAHTGSNHDGSKWEDDDPAGTIASYDSDANKLTIDLAKGGSVSGLVTSRTWIDDGDRGCRDHNGGGDASRKAKQARKGGKKARAGNWCHERRGKRGDDRGWHHGWRDGDESDLVAGAVVEDAIVVLKDGRAWFAKVELDD